MVVNTEPMTIAREHEWRGPAQGLTVHKGFEVGLLGDEAEERRQRRHARGRADGDDEQRLAALPEPGQPADVAGAGCVVDDADDHEQRGLEHGVRAQQRQPGQHQVAAARADHHGDQTELADGAERQDQLQVVFADRAPAGEQHGQHAEGDAPSAATAARRRIPASDGRSDRHRP